MKRLFLLLCLLGLGLPALAQYPQTPNLKLQLPPRLTGPGWGLAVNGNSVIIDSLFPNSACGGDGVHAVGLQTSPVFKFICVSLSNGSGNITGSLNNIGIIPRVIGANNLGDGSLIDDGNGVITTNKDPLQFNFGGTNFQINTGSTLLEWVGANYDVTLDGSTGLINFQSLGIRIGSLSPSLPVCTDSSKNLTSVCTAGNLSTTGTPLAGQISVFTDTTHVQGLTGFTYDPVTGNLTVPGTITAGAAGVAGMMAWKYGTVPSLITGGITEYAAASGTDFSLIKPSAPSSGLVHWTNAAGIVTESIGTVAGSDMASHTVTASQLATQYAKWESCGSRGLGDGVNAIPNSTYSQFSCVNDTGVTVTLTGIRCFTDNNGSSTLAAANNAGTALLTGPVTCTNTKASGGAAGTQSATVTLAAGDAITFSFVADGTSTQTNWTVSGTY